MLFVYLAMKHALERLGYRNVYHMSTFVNHTEDYEQWDYIIRAKISGRHIPRSVWDALLGDYQVSEYHPILKVHR